SFPPELRTPRDSRSGYSGGIESHRRRKSQTCIAYETELKMRLPALTFWGKLAGKMAHRIELGATVETAEEAGAALPSFLLHQL
ncbi:MAG: hypothetical protein ACM3YE_15690, partial [Bacteroidota bacterium]